MSEEQLNGSGFNKPRSQGQSQAEVQTYTQAAGGPAGAVQPGKKPYFVIAPGPLTCKTDIAGLEFDFNYGLRVKVKGARGHWRVKFTDREARGYQPVDFRIIGLQKTIPHLLAWSRRKCGR